MAGENIYSSIQLSQDRWFDLYEILCYAIVSAKGEKLEKLVFLQEGIRAMILGTIDRSLPIEESNG